jgi:DUF4097 and DUF4098 domain-containing protein YvlB
MKQTLILGIFLILLICFSACRVNASFNGKTVVDNVVLDYDNSQKITDTKQTESLELDLSFGDVDIQGRTGTDFDLMVEYKEFEPSDATIFIKDGKLSYETKSGKPAAIISVTGTIPRDIALSVDSGSGDIKISELKGNNALVVDTGSGDVDVSNSVLKLLDVDTGSGDVIVTQSELGALVADTGSGNVELTRSKIDTADVDTGSGDIILLDSEVKQKTCETGSGKVKDVKSEDSKQRAL